MCIYMSCICRVYLVYMSCICSVLGNVYTIYGHVHVSEQLSLAVYGLPWVRVTSCTNGLINGHVHCKYVPVLQQ